MMFRSFVPFLLASFGFTLIALTVKMPLFEWQISEVVTDLPSEFHINPFWTTKPGESLETNSYILNQVVMPLDGNKCSPEQLTYMVRRSRGDERLEQIALGVYQRIMPWLTGLTQTGQFTIGIILSLCGIYVWWFTVWHNRPTIEAFITTVVAAILLGFLINVWRLLVPEVGVFVCRPGLHGTVTFNARLSKVHYETLLVLFTGICTEVGAFVIMLYQVIRAVIERKESSNR